MYGVMASETGPMRAIDWMPRVNPESGVEEDCVLGEECTVDYKVVAYRLKAGGALDESEPATVSVTIPGQ